MVYTNVFIQQESMRTIQFPKPEIRMIRGASVIGGDVDFYECYVDIKLNPGFGLAVFSALIEIGDLLNEIGFFEKRKMLSENKYFYKIKTISEEKGDYFWQIEAPKANQPYAGLDQWYFGELHLSRQEICKINEFIIGFTKRFGQLGLKHDYKEIINQLNVLKHDDFIEYIGFLFADNEYNNHFEGDPVVLIIEYVTQIYENFVLKKEHQFRIINNFKIKYDFLTDKFQINTLISDLYTFHNLYYINSKVDDEKELRRCKKCSKPFEKGKKDKIFCDYSCKNAYHASENRKKKREQ